VIRYPGGDQEEVLHSFEVGHMKALSQSLLNLERDERLTEKQRARVAFWTGYFYAHDVRGS
jgi:hypothetical protein